MIPVLLSWIFIAFVSFHTGVIFHCLLNYKDGFERPFMAHFSVITISGLLVTGFISNVLCLFIPLGLFSQLLLLVVAVAGMIAFKNQTLFVVKYNVELLKQTPFLILLLSTTYLFILAYLSSLPSSHVDDGLYYSTSIKWLQEYGTVKGLANINPRIAFNSSWLVLQAHHSFSFLKIGLFNDLNGLLFFLIFIYTLGGILKLLRGDYSFQTLLRALILLPALCFHHSAESDFMLFNINFLSSPSADIPAAVLTWFIFLLLIENAKVLQQTKGQQELQGIFLLYCVMLVTIKLTTAPVLLLPLFLWINNWRMRHFKAVVLMGLLSVILLLPWLIRNVLLSGYLVFPFSAIDIFNVDWKLPLENVYWFESAVKAFAISGQPETSDAANIAAWFPAWFEKLNFVNSVLLIMVLLCTVSYLLIAAVQFLKKGLSFFSAYAAVVLTLVIAASGILLWFLKGPDFRFGYGFIILYCSFGVVWMTRFFLEDLSKYTSWFALTVIVVAIVFVHSSDLFNSFIYFSAKPLTPRMPDQLKTGSFTGGEKIYIVPGGGIWNAPLPATTEEEYIYIKPEMRGKSIKDGFYAVNKQH
ncbi:LIC_10190 family membrane protein [Lacibacter sp. MH-610]|uniref:LIC_10190 family membrane protein n=1 Tax=Lacibacter sp. MH-610 TaxID=3020883 RepID=UPI00389187CA